jgi:hypothetical protein
MPDCPMELEQLEGLGEFGFDSDGDLPGCRVMRFSGDHRQSLNDILGDIPMERVKSYSIKDTKNGKRIVIELNNAPIFEKENKIIVIREPRRHEGRGNNSEHRVKVIRHMDEDTKVEKSTAPSSTPPPPPPPPDTKPGKTPSKTPKI